MWGVVFVDLIDSTQSHIIMLLGGGDGDVFYVESGVCGLDRMPRHSAPGSVMWFKWSVVYVGSAVRGPRG